MNVFKVVFRIAVVAMSTVGLTNMAGDHREDCARYARPVLFVFGYHTAMREDTKAVKHLWHSMGYAVSEDAKEQLYLVSQRKEESSKDERYYVACARMAGYVAINGTLRHVADKYSVNEEYIDKKCDEYLPESIALYAKPVAKVAVDLAYDCVTVGILQLLQSGSDKK